MPEPVRNQGDETPAAADVLRMTLDVRVGVEPLSGVLMSGDVEHPFEGWLSLAGAVQRALDSG